MTHFGHLRTAVETPISVARAEYWMGRALEAKGDKAGAKTAYKAAAQNQTAFYGLMAAEKLDLSLDPALVDAGKPQAGWKTAGFAGSSVLAAGRALAAAGDRTLAKRFFLHLADSLNGKELEQLADLALRMEEPHIALLVAKAAAERGLILARSYYPVPDMVPDGLPISRALALAISRRESEFDPRAQSPAGARGLMQVMPETAARVAKGLGEESSAGKLTSDPEFNVRVGSTYLKRMVDEFGPAVALIASGYNAGPGRPRGWIGDFGDPRRTDVDVVDWIETIPFTETRTYVMRVAEGVVIYRARLKGAAGPVQITSELTGR
jgi:soluble lytic murein transglycosylase